MQGATTIDYFNGIKTSRGANLRWRSLAKKHHPDRGGDPDVMAVINQQYRDTLVKLKSRDPREPVMQPPYEPPPQEVTYEPAPERQPLISNDEIEDVADKAASFAESAVRTGVKALMRRFARK